MKLKKFIEQLKFLQKKHGDSIDVIMADNIPVVRPVFSGKYPQPSVVITDQE